MTRSIKKFSIPNTFVAHLQLSLFWDLFSDINLRLNASAAHIQGIGIDQNTALTT